MDASAEGPILCPLDGRRTSKELYVKLVIVHFTTITAFYHFLSISKDPLLSLRPLFFVLTPVNIIIQYGLAFLAIACGSLFSLKPDSHFPSFTVTSPKRAFRWLFGMPPKSFDNGPPHTPLLMSSAPFVTRHTSDTPPGRLTPKVFAQIIIQLAFLAQCIGAIYFYTRRQRNDAVAIVDQRILELACGGVMVTALTMAIVAKIPIFVNPVPESESPSLYESNISFLRFSWHGKFSGIKNTNSVFERVIKDGALSFLTVVVCGEFRFLAPFRKLFNGAMLLTNSGPEKSTTEETLLMLVLGLGCFGAYSYVLQLKQRLDEDRGESEGGAGSRWPYLICPFVEPLGMIMVSFWIAFTFAIAVMIREYIRLFAQISEFEAWPQSVDCPMLWKDPLSRHVWWLA